MIIATQGFTDIDIVRFRHRLDAYPWNQSIEQEAYWAIYFNGLKELRQGFAVIRSGEYPP